MTEKHFLEIAAVISSIEDIDERRQAAGWIGQVCIHIYGNFDWDKWHEACDISQLQGLTYVPTR